LYFAYTREKRFTKVMIMIEKLLLLAVILYFQSKAENYRTLAGMIIVVISFISVVITQPYSDFYEDVMDTSCTLTNSVNAFVGVIGDLFGLSDEQTGVLQSTILAITNLVNLAVILLIFLSVPLIGLYAKRKIKRILEEREYEKELGKQAMEQADRAKKSDVEMPLISSTSTEVESVRNEEDGGPSNTTTTTPSPSSEAPRKRQPPPAIRNQTTMYGKSRGALTDVTIDGGAEASVDLEEAPTQPQPYKSAMNIARIRGLSAHDVPTRPSAPSSPPPVASSALGDVDNE